MKLLMGFSIIKVVLIVLMTSLTLLVLIILYKKLIAHLNKAAIPEEDYCTLYPLENHPSKGEIEFYFTTIKARKITLEILNDDLSPNSIIVEKDITVGGNIIRFDTNKLPNGTYFYQLRTENQKAMKRFSIVN